MRLITAYQKLDQLHEAALQTRDAAGVLDISIAHASKILERLAHEKLVVPIKKGVWAFPGRMHHLILPRFCAAPFPCYISLQTALYYHDMILQIPTITYAVSLARTKSFATPLGEVSLHHIAPEFFFGYELDPKTGIMMATPEKALLDFLYLSTSKTHLFNKLPELEFPKKFSQKKARAMIEKIPSAHRRTLVRGKFARLFK